MHTQSHTHSFVCRWWIAASGHHAVPLHTLSNTHTQKQTHTHTRTNTLPLPYAGGELQRVAIALCLGQPADIYLIDEPSAYLDSEQRILASKVRDVCVHACVFVHACLLVRGQVVSVHVFVRVCSCVCV